MAKIYGVTTQATASNDKKIGIIKEDTNGAFAYSTDGSTFKTVSGGGSGSKSFDYVVAPAGSGITGGVDVVLNGTDDQTAINTLINDTIKPTGKSKVIKFLRGTVNLTGSIITDIGDNASLTFIGDGDVTFINSTNSENSYFSGKFTKFRGLNFETVYGGAHIIDCDCELIDCTFTHANIQVSGGIPSVPAFIKCTGSSNNVEIYNCKFERELKESIASTDKFIENIRYLTIGNSEFYVERPTSDDTSGLISGFIYLNNDETHSKIYNSIFRVGNCATPLSGIITGDPDSMESETHYCEIDNCKFITTSSDAFVGPDGAIVIKSNVENSTKFTNCYLELESTSAGNFVEMSIIDNCFVSLRSGISTSTALFKADIINNCEVVSGSNNSIVNNGTIFNANYITNCNVTNIYGCLFDGNEGEIINCHRFGNTSSNSQTSGSMFSGNKIRNCSAEVNGAVLNQSIFSGSALESCVINNILPITLANSVCKALFSANDTITNCSITGSGAPILVQIGGVKLFRSLNSSIRNCDLNAPVSLLGSTANCIIWSALKSVENCNINAEIDASADSSTETQLFETQRIQSCNCNSKIDIPVINMNGINMSDCYFSDLSVSSSSETLVSISNCRFDKLTTPPWTLSDSATITNLDIWDLNFATGYQGLFVAIPASNASFRGITIGNISGTNTSVYLIQDIDPTEDLTYNHKIIVSDFTIDSTLKFDGLLYLINAGSGTGKKIYDLNVNNSSLNSKILNPQDIIESQGNNIETNLTFSNLTLNGTNYSSTAAVKYQNNKPYIYDVSTNTWSEIQLVIQS